MTWPNCGGRIRGVFPSPSPASRVGMSPRAVMRIAPAGQPIMDRNVRRVHPRSLLKTAA